MQKRTLLVAQMVLTMLCLARAAQAQQQPDYDKVVIQTVQVSDGFYILVGAGGHIGVSVGSDGILLVDNQYTPLYGKIIEALRKISSQPIRFVVNTHWHGDHIGGNEGMAKNGTVIVAHENVRARLIRQRSNPNTDWRNPPMPDGTLPVMTYSSSMTLHFNGNDVDVIHFPTAHTDGDSIVYFRQANILHAGDLFAADRYSSFIVDNGGTVDGMIAAMEGILKVAKPDTKIIPGHGVAPVTVKEVQAQRDAFVAIRDRVQTAIRAGQTLEQIIASQPTAEFDARNKAGRPPEEFLTMVYADLARKSAAGPK